MTESNYEEYLEGKTDGAEDNNELLSNNDDTKTEKLMLEEPSEAYCLPREKMIAGPKYLEKMPSKTVFLILTISPHLGLS